MKTKIQGLKVVTLVVLMISFYSVASANTTYANMPAKKNKTGKADILSELNLTTEQQDKMKAQKEELKQKGAVLKEQIKAKRLELKEAMLDVNVDVNKIKSLANDIKNILGQLVDLRVDGILSLKNTITPEQFAKFQEIAQGKKEKAIQKFKDRKEKRMGSNKPSNAPIDNQEDEELNEGL